VPRIGAIEHAFRYLQVSHVVSHRERGWWSIRVYCSSSSTGYQGKRDRTFLGALRKSLLVLASELQDERAQELASRIR